MRLDTSENFLAHEEEQTLLSIARAALEAYVRRGETVSLERFDLTENLRAPHGAFVTLHKQNMLRGCIGYIMAQSPLAETVRDNAINAASRDPRFPAVQPSELADIHIEVSALTPGEEPGSPFKTVHNLDDIVIGRDGLYIERPGTRGGILLPQVPVEQGWNRESFLEGICMKAGYPSGAWNEAGIKLCRFSAQVFGEDA